MVKVIFQNIFECVMDDIYPPGPLCEADDTLALIITRQFRDYPLQWSINKTIFPKSTNIGLKVQIVQDLSGLSPFKGYYQILYSTLLRPCTRTAEPARQKTGSLTSTPKEGRKTAAFVPTRPMISILPDYILAVRSTYHLDYLNQGLSRSRCVRRRKLTETHESHPSHCRRRSPTSSRAREKVEGTNSRKQSIRLGLARVCKAAGKKCHVPPCFFSIRYQASGVHDGRIWDLVSGRQT